jgi:hypothetical protein
MKMRVVAAREMADKPTRKMASLFAVLREALKPGTGSRFQGP